MLLLVIWSYLPSLKVEQINFGIQFWKQCCSVMHDWRNFNNVSFESMMVILYHEGMTSVIHPGTWSQPPFVFRGLFFFLDALYTRNRDPERSMINATTFERRFEKRLQRRFDYGYWNVFLLLEKVINAPYVCLFSHGCINNSLLIDQFCFCSLFMIWNEK